MTLEWSEPSAIVAAQEIVSENEDGGMVLLLDLLLYTSITFTSVIRDSPMITRSIWNAQFS